MKKYVVGSDGYIGRYSLRILDKLQNDSNYFRKDCTGFSRKIEILKKYCGEINNN